MAITEVYVDPSIAADSGSGAPGDPYGDLQYALNNATRNTADGTYFHIKSGTAESLTGALSMTTFGASSESYPVVFQGYSANAGDGGIGAIDCNGNQVLTVLGKGIFFRDMEIFDGPSVGTALIEIPQYSGVVNCYLHDSPGTAIKTSSGDSYIVGNRIEQCGNSTDPSIRAGHARMTIAHNYITDLGNASYKPNEFILSSNTGVSIIANIIHQYATSSTGDGILISGSGSYGGKVIANTILSEGGTGAGITGNSSRHGIFAYVNNYIEGFSGTGGYAVDLNNGGFGSPIFIGNRYFNCANDHRVANLIGYPYTVADGFEKLVATGIEKSGAKTYANRFVYFEPKSSGSMLDTWPESGSI